MTGSLAKLGPLACLMAGALTVAACGETVSTASFRGESRNVAQAISDFQKDATAGDRGRLCQNDLAGGVTASLKRAGGCQAVLERQLRQVDALSMSVESISLKGATAQARVKSTWSGRSRISTLTLVKESGRWKISAAQG